MKIRNEKKRTAHEKKLKKFFGAWSVISKAKFVSQKITLQLINSYASGSRHIHTCLVDMVFGATKRGQSITRSWVYFYGISCQPKKRSNQSKIEREEATKKTEKKLMANLSGGAVFLMLLYTFHQIEMNLRKPDDIYRFVTSVGRLKNRTTTSHTHTHIRRKNHFIKYSQWNRDYLFRISRYGAATVNDNTWNRRRVEKINE